MKVNTSAPWHKDSFDRFINQRLPELLGERLPMAAYEAETSDTYTCKVKVTFTTGNGDVAIEYPSIPRPDDDGLFLIDGKKRVVVPIALSDDLAEADVLCVGEQMHRYIEERLGQAPADLTWDENLARSLLPLDRWIDQFLRVDGGWGNGGGAAQMLDETNWLSRHVHLRRLLTPDGGRLLTPGHFGRVCPFETPEGPNLGRVHTIANGAEIRDGKLCIVEEGPQQSLGMGALMVPFLEHDDPNRLLMGINMMRQRRVPLESEPAIVRTGFEPDEPDFWCGLNLLTAYVSWGIGTYEDAITISESAARRFRYEDPIEPGDKLANRHGAKGVISRILPDDEMPHLADGTPVELVYNVLGCFTRLNFGQIREAVMGRIARAEGKPAIVPPFGAPDEDEIRGRLAKAKLPESGMETLAIGRGGGPLPRPSTVGVVYWASLVHTVVGKIHATTSPSGRPNLQGHLEYCALRDAGAYNTILETFNTRSVQRVDAHALAERVAAGPVGLAPPPTPPFADLVRRLRAAGVSAVLGDDGLAFSLAPAAGPVLKLAHPVPHPWLGDRTLSEVGIVEESPGWAALVRANAKLDGLRRGDVPAGLTANAEAGVVSAVEEFFKNLITPERLRFSAGVPASSDPLGGRASSPGETRWQRILFSGRSVITPGEGLTVDQVGLPDEIAWELFTPLLARDIGKQEAASRSESAAKALDSLMARSWVIINRAPSMWPTNLLAFHPLRHAGRDIRIHPLACMPINGDFDGDQVAVFLPITDAGQREAGERLSIAGHIARDPETLRLFAPTQDMVWGLALLSLTPEGAREVADLMGIEVAAPDGYITRATLIEALKRLRERDGVEACVAALDRMAVRGFEVMKATGASFSPFFGETVERPLEPSSDHPDAWQAYAEDLTDRIAARRDFESDDIGPQLFAAKTGARGHHGYLTALVGSRGLVVDAARKLAPLRHGLVRGLVPDEALVCAVGAREGLARAVEDVTDAIRSKRTSRGPGASWGMPFTYMVDPKTMSYGVLARAMRSERPGPVFAHAAAAGEVDPLTDPDSRLFVGLLPHPFS